MGKIIKNIALVLIAFLLITLAVAAFSNNNKTKDVSMTDIVNLIDQQKVTNLTISDNQVTAKVKDSDTQETAILGHDDFYEILKDSGLSSDKIRAVNVTYTTQSF